MGKKSGVHFRQSHFIAWSVCVPFNHSWKFWNCAENMATRQERERERKGSRGREREKGKVGACVKSQQSSEGGPMGATHLYARHPPPCCLERLLPGDWSHPPGSLRPLSPPPLQTLVCDYLLSLPPILCMKSTATHTHALRHIQNNFEYIQYINTK